MASGLLIFKWEGAPVARSSRMTHRCHYGQHPFGCLRRPGFSPDLGSLPSSEDKVEITVCTRTTPWSMVLPPVPRAECFGTSPSGFAGTWVRVVENRDPDPDFLRMVVQIAAPGFFLAFPVAHLHHCNTYFLVLSQKRYLLVVTHDLSTLQPLEDFAVNKWKIRRSRLYDPGAAVDLP